MTRRIIMSTLSSIGAVPDGDNPEAKIMLWKQKPREGQSTETEMELSKEQQAAIDAAIADARAEWDTEKAELQKQIADLTPEPDPIETADDPVKEAFAKQADELEALRKQLADETAARRTAELTKAVEPYQQILGDDAVKHLASMNQETVDWLLDKIGAADRVMKVSPLFKEYGEGESGDPTAQIAALAVEKQQQNPDLTDAQARQLVRKERPDLRDAERTA